MQLRSTFYLFTAFIFACLSLAEVEAQVVHVIDGVRVEVGELIDPDAAKKTPTTAYYDNRYVDELEKEGFFKGLWQH